MGVLNHYIFNDKMRNNYSIFVLRTNEKGDITYKNYGHPYKQVQETVFILKEQLDVLKDQKMFVNGIVYFNYNSNREFNFIDGTGEYTKIKVANQKEELKNHFETLFNSENHYKISENVAEKCLKKLDTYVL